MFQFYSFQELLFLHVCNVWGYVIPSSLLFVGSFHWFSVGKYALPPENVPFPLILWEIELFDIVCLFSQFPSLCVGAHVEVVGFTLAASWCPVLCRLSPSS